MSPSPPSDSEEDAARPQSPPAVLAHLEVQLARRDFLYYNWALAFERPILPFFLYTFVALNLLSFLRVWPQGRAFAGAVLVPLLGYNLWIWISARRLWRHVPQLAAPRVFRFREEGYQVQEGDARRSVGYREVSTLLETRPAFYLLRADGSADLLPKRCLGGSEDAEAARTFLIQAIGSFRLKRSSFL